MFEFKPQCDNVECINWCSEFGRGRCGCAEEFDGCDENFINDDMDDEDIEDEDA